MQELFGKYGVVISSSQVEMLDTYYDLLVSWNEKTNLTSITDYDDVVVKHFLDSALLLSSSIDEFNSASGTRVLDVGTGAGFPGLVLAILRPEWSIVLLDSLNKRIDFLNDVIKKLSLNNVITIHGRAEDIARNEDFRKGFDLVVSRAVADMSLLLEFCIPFVKDEGCFVAYKGPKYSDEIRLSNNALDELNAKFLFVKSFDLSGADRMLVFFDRDGELPDKYPRRAGIPAKRPL